MDEGRNMILLFPTLINWESPEERKNFDIRYPFRYLFYNRSLSLSNAAQLPHVLSTPCG